MMTRSDLLNEFVSKQQQNITYLLTENGGAHYLYAGLLFIGLLFLNLHDGFLLFRMVALSDHQINIVLCVGHMDPFGPSHTFAHTGGTR